MVKRGVVIPKPNSNNSGFGVFWWIFKMLHRYLFIYYLYALIFGFLGFWYSKKIDTIWFGILGMEVLFFTIAMHETGHYSFAKFLYLESSSLSIIPYRFEIRINFLKNDKINEEDFASILLAGPGISIFIILLFYVLLFIFGRFLYPATYYLYFIGFIIILFNLMALLPLRESDGGRAYKIIKKRKGSLKRIFGLFLFYVSVLLKVNSTTLLKELHDSAVDENLKDN